jgi:dipeptidyl aminopeptidase/acylaminoacyl peptidase
MLVVAIAAGGTSVGLAQRSNPSPEGGNLHPAWSPDGRWIAFESDRDGDTEIFVMASNGTRLRQLTRNKTPDGMPSWSADGKSILFMRGHMQQHPQWFQVPLGGGPVKPAPHGPANPDSVHSTDGRLTVYTQPDDNAPAGGTAHTGPSALFIRLGTAAPRRVSPPGHAEEPRLSPDQLWVVFEHRRPEDELIESVLYLVPSDGSAPPRQLTTGTNPSWSPDGRRILFKSWDATRRTLVIGTISPDGSRLRLLADGVIPSWSPDGTQILYMGPRGGHWEVMVMTADGSEPRCLTC